MSTILTIVLVIKDCFTYQNFVERFWTYTMPFIVISSCAWFVFVKNISNKFNRTIQIILRNILEKSLGIYAVHFLFITFLWNHSITTFLFNGILSVPVISAIVFSAVTSLQVLCRKYQKLENI